MSSSLTDILNQISDVTGNVIDQFTSEAQKASALVNRITSDPVGTAFKQSRFITTYMPPIDFKDADLKNLIAGKKVEGPEAEQGFVGKLKNVYLKRAQPTITIESPLFGNYTYAPYGAVGPEDWKANWTKAILIAGAGLAAYTILVYSIGHRRGSRSTG